MRVQRDDKAVRRIKPVVESEAVVGEVKDTSDEGKDPVKRSGVEDEKLD